MTAPEPRDSATHPTTPTPTRSAVLGAAEGQETAAGGASEMGRVQSAHDLKTWPEFYAEVEAGRKTVEVRKDDRAFAVGDTLLLREWDPMVGDYTGRWTARLVTHVLRGWGVQDGYVALSITNWMTALDVTTPASTQPRGAK